MKNNELYNEEVIKRLTSNITINEKQREAAIRWISLLKKGELEKEKKVYIEFANTILKKLLSYDIGVESLPHESGNMEFPFLKPDGTYGVFFEAKGAKFRNLFGKQYRKQIGYFTPVSQTWTKMSQYPIPYGVCTNYKDFILMDYSKGNRKYHVFNFLEIENNDDKLKEFIAIFSRNSIIDNNFLEELLKKTTEEDNKFSSEFYSIFHETRLMLIEEFKECGLEIEQAIKYSQLFLNRIIFIFFAESTGKMPKKIFQNNISNILKSTLIFNENTHIIYNMVIHIFGTLDTGSESPIKIFGFNGELFKEEFPTSIFFKDYRSKKFFKDIRVDLKESEKLEINEEITNILNMHKQFLNPIVKNLFKMGSFNFNTEANINILGHIFEQSISDIEELKGLKEISKRKQEGIYYTPEFITDYICYSTIISYLSNQKSQSIEELLEEYSEKINELEEKINNIRILDISCGSGAFLLKAIDVLIDIKKDIIEFKGLKGLFKAKSNSSKIKTKGKEEINQSVQISLDKFNEVMEIRNIVQKNIYGVDLNEESVEITKLSIFFKICQNNEKLLDLKDILKCGDSLISDSSIVGKKAFDWETRFKEIMSKGGFDIIIGNPPYINGITMKNHFPKQRDYLKKNYSFLIEKWDIYVAFLEKALELLKPNGYLSYIIPDAFLREKYAEKIQIHIKNNLRVKKIDYFPGINIFKGVGVHNIILTIQKAEPELPVLKKCFKKLEQNPIIKKIDDIEDIFSSFESEIIDFDIKNTIPLTSICYISKGMVLHSKAPEYKGLFKKDDIIFDFKSEKHSKIIFGENIVPFNINGFKYIEWNTERVPNKLSRPTFPELHQKNKLTSNKLGKLKIAFDDYGYKCDQTVRILIKWHQIQSIENKSINGSLKKFSKLPRNELEQISEKYDYLFLLAILNSEFIRYYFNKLRGESSFDINPLVLRQIPVPKIENLDEQKQIINLTKVILKLIEEKTKIQTNFIDLFKNEFSIQKTKKLELWFESDFNNFIIELERVIRKKKKGDGITFSKLSLKQKSEWINLFKEKKDIISRKEEETKKIYAKLNSIVFQLYKINNKGIKQIIES